MRQRRRAVSSTCASWSCQIRLPRAAHRPDPVSKLHQRRHSRGPPATHQAAAEDGAQPDLHECHPTAVAGRCPKPNTKKLPRTSAQTQRERGEGGALPPPSLLAPRVVPRPGLCQGGRLRQRRGRGKEEEAAAEMEVGSPPMSPRHRITCFRVLEILWQTSPYYYNGFLWCQNATRVLQLLSGLLTVGSKFLMICVGGFFSELLQISTENIHILYNWGSVTAVCQSSTERTLRQFCICINSDSPSSKPCAANCISASMELT
jgi:hypothetical protein